MRILMAALAAAVTLAAATPASAKYASGRRRYLAAPYPRYAAWPAGWQNVPLENRGGACPDGDCGLLPTRRS
jgi:hypothetical protein